MRAYVEVPARQRDNVHPVLVDVDDYLHVIHGRSLSLASHGYVQVCPPGDGKSVLLHRLLLGLKVRDGRIGDHVNGNPLDNRRANLRIVTPGQSSANMAAQSRTGYRGVYATKYGKFYAKATVGGVSHHLGTFATAEAADEAAHEFRLAHMPGYVERPGARRVLARSRRRISTKDTRP